VPTERDRRAPPMDRRVRGIHHVGVTVRNLERSLAFYRDLVGAVVIRISSDVDVATIVGLPGARARIADLDAGNGQVIELLEYSTADAPAVAAGRADTIGSCHVCLEVADLDSSLARLARAGVAPVGEAVELHDEGWQNCTVAYLRDPDGLIVELLERGCDG
jgi:catechol 2,3-dioxygenase-like lactoylglutathione lyase family enzyme